MAIDAGWFQSYLSAFVACARGDGELGALLRHYGCPLIISSDDGVVTLTTEEDLAAVMQGELDGLRAIGYDHTDVVHLELTSLNSTSALIRGTFSRRDRHGHELNCPTVTYLVTEDGAGPRISVLAAHGG